MQRRTNHALLLSLGLHIVLVLIVSPLFITHFDPEKESISAELLEADPEKLVKRRVLPPRLRPIRRAATAEASADSPASPTYAPRVNAPKAPVHDDVVPDVVTHTDISQAEAPSPVSNASFGEDQTVGGPVVIRGQRKRSSGSANVGFNGLERQRGGIGTQFSQETGASEVGLEVPIKVPDHMDAGLGIFTTEVLPGHGLVGEVYVPRGPITKMPNFDHLVPIYTFVTANLNVPTRNYTQGFPTPEKQTVLENFAIRFRAELEIKTPGLYTFTLYSDDGSQLYIDGDLVVNNDGIHPTIGKQGRRRLTTGMHSVEVRYFQGPRHAIALQWLYQPPNGQRQIVPPAVIYRQEKPGVPDALKKLQQRLRNIGKKKDKNSGDLE